jgi:hypothetical protein
VIARYQAKDGKLEIFSCFMVCLLEFCLIHCCIMSTVVLNGNVLIIEVLFPLWDILAMCNQHTYDFAINLRLWLS